MDANTVIGGFIAFLLFSVPWSFAHPRIDRWWTQRSARRRALWAAQFAMLKSDRHEQFLAVAEEGRCRASATLWMVCACTFFIGGYLVEWRYPTHEWFSNVVFAWGALLYIRSFLKHMRASNIEMLLDDANQPEGPPDPMA